MMKNKFLIGVVTFFVAISFCVIFLNVTDSNTSKKYYFDRKFSNHKFLKFKKKANKSNEEKYVMYVKSDSCLIERDKVEFWAEKSKYKFYFLDLDLVYKKMKDAILPSSAYLLLYKSNQILYSLKFDLFVYDFGLKVSRKIHINSFKVFDINPLPNSTSKFLCFGEYLLNNDYVTGFYIVDINSEKIQLMKKIQSNKTSVMLENFLIYSGDFSSSIDGNDLAYFCDKYSKIYFFDSEGRYVKELTTKENVPLPKILTNEKGDNFYSRGDTWSTNKGVIFDKKNVFVFSGRSEFETNVIIDEYSYENLIYNKSYRVYYNNYNSKNIANVRSNKDNVIITFDTNYASFKF